MRAIVNREHKKALAERRAAQEAHAAKTRPAPTRVGWSSKPGPKPKPAVTDAVIAQQTAAQRKCWRDQHPELAAAERGLRKQRADMQKRWDHKRDGTAETHEHAAGVRQGALARLYQSGAIDAEQLAAAADIATVVERIGADVCVRTASLETHIDTPANYDGSFFERLGQVRREVAYGRWRRALAGSAQPVLEMIVDDAGVTVVAKRWRMHNRRARKMLIDALDLWPTMLGDAYREIDAAALAAAHAGLLA